MNTEQAVNVLRSRWADFVALERDILDLQHRAAVAAGSARQAGNDAGAEAAKEVIRRLGDLSQLHLKIVTKLEGLAAQLPGLLDGDPFEGTQAAGLGALPFAIPVWAVATVVATAGAMLLFFSRFNTESAALESIEAAIAGTQNGTLSPAEAAQLLQEARALLEAEEATRPPSPLGELAGDAGKLVLVGVALWLLVTRAGGPARW